MPNKRLPIGWIALVPFLLAAAACGNESDADPTGTPTGPETTVPSTDDTSAPQECPEVISATVIETLGWTPDSSAVQARGGCAWSGEQGNVVVVERAETYNDECERLTEVAPPTTFRSEVADGVHGCGYVRDDGLGLSEWVVDVDGRVISLSVAALTPTASEPTRAALLALAETAPNVSFS